MNITSILTKTLLGVGIPFVIAALGYIAANGLFVTRGHHGDEHYLASKDHGAEAEKEVAKAEPVFEDLFAQADLFAYSDTMKGLGGQWTPERMNTFLTKPKDMVPGTKMSFAGLKKMDQRANLIAYLASVTE
ncbi:MAG: hypothetical protein CSA68_12415 [Rhodobacterales bacterium]|nr:MAG: hypothetical protein CSA68_12415 [Rhodobacterales bacterium]